MAAKRKRVRKTARKSATVTFTRWDAADHLKTEEDMAAYLAATMTEAADEPAVIAAALGDIARARGMMQLSKDTGITREGLYKALGKDGNPSLDTIMKVASALGLTIKFVPKAEAA